MEQRKEKSFRLKSQVFSGIKWRDQKRQDSRSRGKLNSGMKWSANGAICEKMGVDGHAPASTDFV